MVFHGLVAQLIRTLSGTTFADVPFVRINMDKVRRERELDRYTASRDATPRANPRQAILQAAPVADASRQDWQKYTDGRMRQFAGRR
jgi:hypothetical protein